MRLLTGYSGGMWISCLVLVTLVALALVRHWRRNQRAASGWRPFVAGLGRWWKKGPGPISTEPHASVFASDKMIILVKNKVWVNGPIYIHDVPWQRLMPDDLDGIQRFLCEILTTPMKQEGGNMPATVPVKEFLRLLQAKSLRQAVEAYKCLQVRVENNALIATIYNRELSTKSWSTTETVVREPKWQQEKLGAQALLAAFALAE